MSLRKTKFSTNHWLAFETSIRSYIDVSKAIEKTENCDTTLYWGFVISGGNLCREIRHIGGSLYISGSPLHQEVRYVKRFVISASGGSLYREVLDIKSFLISVVSLFQRARYIARFSLL